MEMHINRYLNGKQITAEALRDVRIPDDRFSQAVSRVRARSGDTARAEGTESAGSTAEGAF